MAKSIVAQRDPVPFLTSADTYLLPVDPQPSLAIVPEASAETLWLIAESRLQQLEGLLNILSCTGETEIVVHISEVANLMLPQVQGALMLAKEGNQRVAAGQRS